MKLPLSFSLDDRHFEYRKCVNSQLKQEVNFKLGSFGGWPVWVFLVNFGALSTTSNNWREPVLFSEENIGYNRSEGVKARVKAEFQDISGLFVPSLTLVFLVDDLINFTFHEVVVTVFGDLWVSLKVTKMKEKPTATQIRESTAKT